MYVVLTAFVLLVAGCGGDDDGSSGGDGGFVGGGDGNSEFSVTTELDSGCCSARSRISRKHSAH